MNSSSHPLPKCPNSQNFQFSYLHISLLYMTVRNFSLLTLIERIFLSEFQLFALHRNEGPSKETEMKRTSCSQSERQTGCFVGTVTEQYTVGFCIRGTRNSMINPFQRTSRQVKCMKNVWNLYRILTKL
jgi:hypothetical protein